MYMYVHIRSFAVPCARLFLMLLFLLLLCNLSNCPFVVVKRSIVCCCSCCCSFHCYFIKLLFVVPVAWTTHKAVLEWRNAICCALLCRTQIHKKQQHQLVVPVKILSVVCALLLKCSEAYRTCKIRRVERSTCNCFFHFCFFIYTVLFHSTLPLPFPPSLLQ